MFSSDGARYLPTRVRRLSPAEIVRSARDVFAGAQGTHEPEGPALRIALAAFEVVPPFTHAAIETEVDEVPDPVRRWIASLAGRIAKAIAESSPRLHSESKIIGGFLDAYARRIFREPLSADDRATFMSTFERTREQVPFTVSIATLVGQLFSDGRFLTRTEMGIRYGGIENTTLTQHELATALSYFVWGTPPSDQLLDAASLGILDDARVLEGFTDVMLVDQRGQRVLTVRDSVPEVLLGYAFGAEGGAQVRLDENAVAEIAAHADDPRAVTHAIVASPAFRVRKL